MSPSTNKPVADRAILCQRGSELAEFAPLLADLGIAVEIHTGELPGPEVLAGACLAIVAGQRLAEGKPASLRSWPRTLAVVDDGSKTLAAHLNRIGVAMVIRRPIHPRALRLLLLHELYRGPERRAKKRVLIGHPIRLGVGLFKQNATLLELSRTGARIALTNPPKIGTLIHFALGKELTNSKPMKVQAKIVRSIRPGSGAGAGESEVGVALVNAVELAKPIQAILDRFALGPAMTGPSARSTPAAATPRGLPAQVAARTAPIPAPAAPTIAAVNPAAAASAPPSPSAEARRLPPSYQPASAQPAKPAETPRHPSPAPAAVPVAVAVAVPRAAVEMEHEAFTSDCELELDEDGSDFVLDLDDELPGEATSGEPAASDRRRSARVPFQQRIVALDEQAARVVVGRDLCLGGMRIAANPDVAIGDVLRLALHAGSEMEPLVLLAGVERNDGEDGLVLAFSSLTGPQRERLEKILAASGAIQGPADDEGNQEAESLVMGELLGRVARGRDAAPSRSGFTLVELMIVVAIIGVMSSIAVPLFGRYQYRAKSAEAVANLGAIRVVQEAHFSEHGAYLSANAEPPLIPGPIPAPFDIVGTGYAAMGWSPDGRVYFSYAVAISADSTGYTADAAADIDGNGIVQLWGYSKPDPLGALTMGGLGCDPALLDLEVAGRCSVGTSTF